MLIACVLLLPSERARSQRCADPSVGRVEARLSADIGSSPVWLASSDASRGAKFSLFIPWKTRSKIVLEETKDRINEEHDLGLAIPPHRPIGSMPIELVVHLNSTSLHLRC
jgi:hypothetical protein